MAKTPGLLTAPRKALFETSRRVLTGQLSDRQISANDAAARAGVAPPLLRECFLTAKPTQVHAAALIAIADSFSIAIPLRPPYSKYHNKPTVLDGIHFDSKAEAAYYERLKALEAVGLVRAIECHPLYVFAVNADRLIVPLRRNVTKAEKAAGGIQLASFKPDFAFQQFVDPEWRNRIVDVKINATANAAFNLRARMLEVWFGLTVEIENTDRKVRRPTVTLP